jgi:hypothetical protein
MPRGRTVILPLPLLPPLVREYPELANQLTLRHRYITLLETGRGIGSHEIVLRPLASLHADYADVFVNCPLLLQQLQTADRYLRGLLHQQEVAHLAANRQRS